MHSSFTHTYTQTAIRLPLSSHASLSTSRVASELQPRARPHCRAAKELQHQPTESSVLPRSSTRTPRASRRTAFTHTHIQQQQLSILSLYRGSVERKRADKRLSAKADTGTLQSALAFALLLLRSGTAHGSHSAERRLFVFPHLRLLAAYPVLVRALDPVCSLELGYSLFSVSPCCSVRAF